MTRDQLRYFLAGTGVTIVYVTALSFVHFFIIIRFGINPSLAAVLISALQISVMLVDLTVGQMASRVKLLRGYHPVMVAGAGLSAFGLILLYVLSPSFGNYALIAALSGFVFTMSGLSAFSVVHLGRIAMMNPDPQTRANFIGVRLMFMGVGGFIASIVPPLIVGKIGDANGWAVSAILAAVVSFPLLMAGARGAAQIIVPAAFASNAVAVLRDKPFIGHILGAVILFSINAMIATAAPFFISWGLNLPIEVLSLLLGGQTLANMLALRLWPMLIPYFGVVRTLCLAQAVQALGLALLLVLPNQIGISGIGIGAVMIGVGGAGVMTLSYALLSELTVAHRITTGVDRSTVMAGLWLASEKVYSASGRLLAGAILGFGVTIGRSDAAAMAMVEAPLILSAIGIIYYLWRSPQLSCQLRKVHDENIVLQR
jgi:Na+/melibiose symporter-like transporter